MKSSDLVKYLENNKTCLERVLSSSFLAQLRASALRDAGQTSEKVRERLSEYARHLDKADLDRVLAYPESFEEQGHPRKVGSALPTNRTLG